MSPTSNDWFNTIYGEWGRKEILDITLLMKDKVETVVDIGACIGASVKHYNRVLIPKMIVAFEPDKENCDTLCSLIGRASNIRVCNWGIWYGASRVGVIGWKDGNMGGYHVANALDGVEHYGELIASKTFVVRPLEDSIDFIPDLIKIDVEGSEYNIIENSTIVKQAKFLFIEWHHRTNTQISEFVAKHLPNYSALATDSRSSTLLRREF